MENTDKKISVVVPVYNAEKTITELINRLKNALSVFKEYRIILVNDNSRDGSFDIIKQLASDDKNITAVTLKKNVGQQKATFLGLKYTSGDYTVIIDDDLAQKPEDIIPLYEEIENGYDAVYGIKRNEVSTSFFRNFGSYIRDKLFDAITQKPKDKKVCSFRIITEDIRKKVVKADKEFIYISMEILKHTNNIGNVFVDYNTGGPTNYSFKKLILLIFNMYVYYSKQRMFNRKTLPIDAFDIAEVINGEKQ